jgi:hypothetical protein
MQRVTEDISNTLVQEIGSPLATANPAAAGIVDLLVQQMGDEVLRRLDRTSWRARPADGGIEERLRRMERALDRLVSSEGDADEDEVSNRATSFPNLKYAKPKYQGVQSLLNYMEKGGGEGGMKLVIMNFND